MITTYVPESILFWLAGDLSLERLDNIGLRNISARLKLQYGPKYHLSVMPGDDKGVSIKVRIPGQVK